MHKGDLEDRQGLRQGQMPNWFSSQFACHIQLVAYWGRSWQLAGLAGRQALANYEHIYVSIDF